MAIYIVFLLSFVALLFAYRNYRYVAKLDAGTKEMEEISSYIHEGAKVFLKDENKAVFKAAAAVAVVLAIILNWKVGAAFILGATMSFLSGYIGMSSATISNVRVANVARKTKSIGEALKVAYSGGSVMGLSVAGLALLGLSIVYIVFGKIFGELNPENVKIVTNWLGINYIPFTMTISGYALGCSLIAMFDRVGGGIFTKAADMAADLVGKTELELPEDDPRNPATIADNVGDNVGDIAGLGADLLESFVGSMVAAMILGLYDVVIFNGSAVSWNTFYYPLYIVGVGLVSAMIGITVVLAGKNSDEPQKALDSGLWTAAILTIVLSFFVTMWLFKGQEGLGAYCFRFGWYSPWGALVVGILVGMLTGFWAEYYTSDKYRPTRLLSERSSTGVGVVITGGISLGMRSTFYPIITISTGILLASYMAGLYGIAIAALGMLSFVAASVAVDSYGPIADNAGGISEMAGLEEEVRKITDKLDAVGNTTAAIGKGFAIGSAVLASLSLFASYVFSQMSADSISVLQSSDKTPGWLIDAIGEYAKIYITDPRTVVGVLIGAVLPYLFASIIMDAVSDAAMVMINEVRRQFKSIPGIREGKAKPDYNSCISISNQAALKNMTVPALVALFTPLISGFLFGPTFVGGLLLGATASGALVAITMSNSGGAWDNAKKYLEQGKLEGISKGSEEHKSLVVGDTVGDPMKDAAGPSINILIKIMAIVSILFASIFVKYHLF